MSSPLTPLTNPNTITADGATVTATVWTNNFAAITNYINNSLVASFNASSNKGDIYCNNGTQVAALPVGTNGFVLSANSTQANGLQWISPPGLPTNTNGDLIYYNSGANQRLPIGTGNQVLTVNSGSLLPTWANAQAIPSGVIALWSGTVASIPAGWVLCNGNSGTPNLQGLFIVGAGNTSPAATGGMGLIAPNTLAGDTSSGAGVGAIYTSGTASAQITAGSGGGAAAANTATVQVGPITPRYFALCYIMKQ